MAKKTAAVEAASESATTQVNIADFQRTRDSVCRLFLSHLRFYFPIPLPCPLHRLTPPHQGSLLTLRVLSPQPALAINMHLDFLSSPTLLRTFMLFWTHLLTIIFRSSLHLQPSSLACRTSLEPTSNMPTLFLHQENMASPPSMQT